MISVIIPVYNSEKYLRKCLDSVINQTYKDLEIICVDDCSSDNSLAILNEYAQRDSRIKVLRNESNINVGPSRNRGLDAATGKYVHFMDSDDWLELDAYETLMNTYEKLGDIDLLYFYSRKVSDKSNKPLKWTHFDGKQPKDVCNIRTNPEIIYTWVNYVYNKLFLREFLVNNDIKFNSYPCFEDQEYALKILVNAKSIYYVDKVLYNYRVENSDSITGKYYKYIDCAYKSFMESRGLYENLEPELRDYFIKNEFSKYFSLLESIYLIKKISYEDFRNRLRQIDVSQYSDEVLNSKMFVQYREILSLSERHYLTRFRIRRFTRTYCPMLHKFLMFIRKKVQILGRI